MPENIITDGKDKNSKKLKEKDQINIFYMAKKIYPMCFKSNLGYYIFNQTLIIFHGVSYGANVMVAQMFFDSVYNASTGKNTVQV